MTNLDSVFKGKDITLLPLVWIVKSMVFPVVTYGCKSWTIKMTECQNIDALKLWCWRRLLKVLDSKEIKPVSLKGSQPWTLSGRTDAEAEAPVFWSPDANSWLIGKCLILGKTEGRRRRRCQRMRLMDGHELGQTSGDGEGCWEVWCAAVHGATKSWTQLDNWITTKISVYLNKNQGRNRLVELC